MCCNTCHKLSTTMYQMCGVHGREVERRPRNLEVPSSIPESECQLWDFSIGQHIRHEYRCTSHEAELKEISISCKNLFLNRFKINMLKLNVRQIILLIVSETVLEINNFLITITSWLKVDLSLLAIVSNTAKKESSQWIEKFYAEYWKAWIGASATMIYQ